MFSSNGVELGLDKVEQVIIDGRRLVAKVDAMLRRTEEFNKQYGFPPGELDKYIRENLSPAEREKMESEVSQALRELHSEADRAVESLRAESRPQRKFRPKTMI